MTYKLNGGGVFGDNGPWQAGQTGWDRSGAPGNGGVAGDNRIYSFRHGKRTAHAPADSMRFAAGFYDGHVEVLGDLEGSDPTFWNPRGVTLTGYASHVYDDVAKRFPPDANGNYPITQ
jgi:hypothetical protein